MEKIETKMMVKKTLKESKILKVENKNLRQIAATQTKINELVVKDSKYIKL